MWVSNISIHEPHGLGAYRSEDPGRLKKLRSLKILDAGLVSHAH
ncbi:hypothetical protein [Caldivirga sp.]